MKDSLGLTAYKFITIVFVIAIITCGIVDIAVSGTIDWSMYPFVSTVFAWLILTPLLVMKKNKILSALVMTTVAAMPYLFLLDAILPGKAWFSTVGIPVGVTSIAAAWVTFAIFKHLRVNYWLKAAMTLFLYGVVVNLTTLYSVGTFTGDSFSLLLSVNTAINLAAIVGLIIILLVKGSSKLFENNATKTVERFQN